MLALQKNLTELGLRASCIESLDVEKFERIHRSVGKIQLHGLTEKINLAMELTGESVRVTEGKYRSMYTKEMLVQPLIKFCTPKRFRPRNRKALETAIKRVVKKFVKKKVHVGSLEESYQRLISDKADHFAGLPTLGKKGDDLEALERAKQCWRGKCPPPAVIGHRGKNTEVVRAVWMFPFEWHIVEGVFYFAVFDAIKNNQSIYPVGVISERRYLMRKFVNETGFTTKFSIDYSGFDASLGTQMIGIAFNILSQILILDEQQQKVWERVQTYFTTCPFLAPDGLVYKGRRGGVPSGSMFTQMIDSICNAVAIEYAMICEGVSDYRYLVYGDDSWTVLVTGEEPQGLLERVRTHVGELGLEMNVEKTEYAVPSEPIVFCGHYDIRRGRPLQDAIDKMCYPERPSETLHTREGICERLVAYIADADCMALNAVYLSYYYNVPIGAFIEGAGSNLTVILGQEAKDQNRRHLPGILQVIDAVPREASTLMKIRSAI